MQQLTLKGQLLPSDPIRTAGVGGGEEQERGGSRMLPPGREDSSFFWQSQPLENYSDECLSVNHDRHS
jgi:hypothetical protein